MSEALRQTTGPRFFCGCTEKQLDAAAARTSMWVNKRNLKWYIGDRIPGLALEVLTAAYAQAFAAWQAVCGLTFAQTMLQAEADFVILTRGIDGNGGTLAEHQLPPGNDQQLRGWFDVGDSWTTYSPPERGKIDLVAVATHEFGHGIGLSHTNKPGNLLNPYYDPSVRTPQEWDIAEAVRRYGPPVAAPTPPNPLPPTGGALPAELQIMVEVPGVGLYGPGTLKRQLS